MRKPLEAALRQLNDFFCNFRTCFVGIALFILFCAPMCAYLVCNRISVLYFVFLLFRDTFWQFWIMHADLCYNICSFSLSF
jgi:hypothetical protein